MQSFKKVCSVISFFLILSIFPQVSMAKWPGQIDTGMAGDINTCAFNDGCHEDFTVGTGGGTFSITVAGGSSYTPGAVHTVTVSLSHPSMIRSGFQSKATKGTVAVSDSTTELNGNDANYIEYNKATGSYEGSANATWTFDWTAPSTGLGPVTIYAAGVAGNQNDKEDGDYVYTDSAILTEAVSVTAPAVTGTTPTNDTTPTWSWTAGGGGNGTFRYKLDDTDLTSGATETTDAFYTPSALSDGTHTLYVQESDGVGNWSSSGSFAIVVDITVPTAPTVAGTTPTWTWTTGGGGNGTFRYKLDDTDLTSGATETTDTFYTPGVLAGGTYMLYVQERDDTGNWSTSGSFSMVYVVPIPTLSEWGLIIAMLLLMVSGSIFLRRNRVLN